MVDEAIIAGFDSMKQESRERRARHRTNSAAMLAAAGIAFETRNAGAHLIVMHAGVVVDFWPGTGLWQPRGAPRKERRGVGRLLDFLRTRRPAGAAGAQNRP